VGFNEASTSWRFLNTDHSNSLSARKLKVSFWKFLNDRNSGENVVSRLGDLMRAAALNTC
jgi:hypothetical protein